MLLLLLRVSVSLMCNTCTDEMIDVQEELNSSIDEVKSLSSTVVADLTR